MKFEINVFQNHELVFTTDEYIEAPSGNDAILTCIRDITEFAMSLTTAEEIHTSLSLIQQLSNAVLIDEMSGEGYKCELDDTLTFDVEHYVLTISDTI